MTIYQQLTLEQRYHIQALKDIGQSGASIALSLGVSCSTVTREVKRNSVEGKYTAKQAHALSQNRKKEARSGYKLTPERCELIDKLLEKEWSPEQVCGRLEVETGIQISSMSLYRHIYADAQAGGTLWEHMRHARRKPKPRSKHKGIRSLIKHRRSIHERPAVVDELKRPGDLEMDTIVGPGGRGAIATIGSRSTNYVWMTQCYGKDSWYLSERVKQRLRPVKAMITTITSDNGVEFAEHQRIARSMNIDYYFADPYQTNQRSRIEQLNKLIRQYIPKKQDLDWVQPKELKHIEDKLNHRPRKKLGFKTPHEVFFNTTETLIKDGALEM